jgi:dTMP kinase
MSLDWVIEANSLCADLLRPDLTIFIDVPPETCMKRLKEDRDMMELYETLDNLNKVRGKYFESFEKLSGEEAIFITNGDRSVDAIFTDVWTEIERMYKAHKSYS